MQQLIDGIAAVAIAGVSVGLLSGQGRPPRAIEDAARIVSEVIQHGEEIVRQTRNVVCEQEVERIRSRMDGSDCYQALGDRLLLEGALSELPGRVEIHDRARMQVGWIEGKERFGWPGSDRLSAESPTELLGTGAASSGEFTGHLQAVIQNLKSVAPREVHLEASGLVRIAFDQPRPSLFRVRTQRGVSDVAYEGSLTANSESGEIASLAVYVDEAPEGLGLELLESVTVFSRRKVSGKEMVLPSRAMLRSIYEDGRALTNSVSFRNCNRFVASTEISFDVDLEPTADHPNRSDSPAITIPNDTVFSARLVSDLEWGRSFVGDEVVAELASRVKLAGGDTAAKGSELKGRLLEFQKRSAPEPFFVVRLGFDRLSTERGSVEMAATLDRAPNIPGLDVVMPSAQSSMSAVREEGGFRESTWDTGSRQDPAAGTMIMFGKTCRIPRGTRLFIRKID